MVVHALFFLSGAAGLVFESVFLRQATWLFGSAVTATSLVLSAFMAGLAAGLAAGGRLADGLSRPLRLYGWVEIATGFSGALLAWLLGSGRESLLGPIRAAGSSWEGTATELALAFLLLLVPCALMGASLPALTRFVVEDPANLLGSLGRLYGVNTLGAAAGALLTGFVLFESVGVSASAYLAGGLDASVGAAALLLDLAWSRRQGSPARVGARARPSDRRDRVAARAPADNIGAPWIERLCYAAAGLGGAAVLGYEVVWTRLLSLPMRSYAYSFSLMLALFLSGLVIGALILPLVASRVARPDAALAWIQIGMGLHVASSILWLPPLLAPVEAAGFGSFLLWSSLRAALVVLPPTVLSGMALPLAARAVTRDAATLARRVGGVVAINTAGAVAGALVAGLILIPWIGAPRALVLLAVANALSGACVAAAAVRSPAARMAAVGLALACVLPLAVPRDAFVRGFLSATKGRERIAEVLFYRESATDTVAIVRDDYGFHDPEAKSLITNGIAMSATVKPVWRYMAMEGHLPVLLAAHPSRALVLCLGTGITLGAIASHGDVESIDAVELSEGVIEGLRLFDAENGRALEDPRVRVARQDGRHFLETSLARWDLVTLEPPPPIVAGSAHLYSLDFYRLCRRRLLPGGVVAQWLPLHAQSLESTRMAARTFVEAFPYAQLWLPSVRDAVLVGSPEPIRLDFARLREAYADPTTAANLASALLETPEAFLATFLLDRDGIVRWASGASVMTDEHPLMEFFRGHGETMRDPEIAPLVALPQAGLGWIDGISDDPDLRGRVEAENEALRRYVDSEIRQDPAASVEAARLSAGTEFFLYRLGCDSAQRDFLARHASTRPEWTRASRRCESLLSTLPARRADAPAGRR